jgi:hypothetical protein
MSTRQRPQRASGKPRARPRGRTPRQTAKPQLSGHVRAIAWQDLVLPAPSHGATPATATLLRLAAQLGAPERTVLHALAALRLATSDHVRRLVFATGPDHTQALRARRALQRLHTLGLVGRVDRHIGGHGAGSTNHTHHLTAEAQRLLRLPPTQPPSLLAARDHTLAVTELAVTLHQTHRAGACELVRFEPEPAAWRTWTDNDGHRRHVRPDAFVIVAAGRWERLWFIELDRGTQSPAVIRRKANAYHAYARSGREQDEHGVFPRVAYLTTEGDERCRALARALAYTPHHDQLTTVAPLTHATHVLTHPPDTEQPT